MSTSSDRPGSGPTSTDAATDQPGGAGAHRLVPASALRADQVQVAFDGIEVVRRVDLELRTGEWLGLIGPNGSGKSTLLRALVGLVPSTGTVQLGDGRVPGPADLALMPQHPELPPGMTVVEYVLLGRTAHLGWFQSESVQDRQVATSVLRRLGLAGFAERQVLTLSGGEAQRVVIARALVQQSPVLLLDEPTSALDVGHQVEVLELVDELRREDGLTVVAAMHDLGMAGRYADRLLLLDRGTRVALGSPTEVLQPELLSRVYGHQVQVHVLDGHLVVLPAPRRTKAHAAGTAPHTPVDLATRRRTGTERS